MRSFAEAWANVIGDEPTRIRGVLTLSFHDLMQQVKDNDAGDLVDHMWAGDVLVLKHAFTPEFCDHCINAVTAWGNDREPSFHRMLDGVPDFHCFIEKTADKYAVGASLRHGFYFFRWNDDPLALMQPITRRWRVLKVLAGLPFDAYEANMPSDGVVDRLIVYHYPKGGGFLNTHFDPTNNHRIIMGGLLSKRGRDFTHGGIYFVGDDGQMFDIEGSLDVGDFVIAYPTVHHGVLPVDAHEKLDWTEGGRWFLGLSSVDSDLVAQRVTASRVAA